MNKYKIFFNLFLTLFLVSNLFAGNTNQNLKEEDNNVAYLGLKKQISRIYKITGNFKKDNKRNKKDVFCEYFVFDKKNVKDDEVSLARNYNLSGIG